MRFEPMPGAALVASSDDATATAEAAPTLRGLIAPYGTIGHTSEGPRVIERGAIGLPDDPSRVKLFIGHDRAQPIARALSFEESDEGLYATFAVGSSATARNAYAEALEGIRDGLSVELDAVVERPGTNPPVISHSMLTGVGLTPLPAFADARTIAAELAAPDNRDAGTPDTGQKTNQTETEGNDMPDDTTAPAPVTAAAPAAAVTAAARTRPVSAIRALADKLRTARFEAGDAGITAALTDITGTASAAALVTDARRELWDGRSYVTKYDIACRELELTAAKVSGWAWTTKPAVDAYAGDKADIPSNAAALTDVSVNASRLAGGHDIDRIHVDFDSGFLESYWRAMTDSIAEQYDAARIAALDSAGGTGTAATSVGDAYAQALVALGTVDYMIVASDLAAADLGAPAADLPAALTGGTLYGMNAAPDVRIAPELSGEVLCGKAGSLEFYTERPPIRVEGVNVANGGVDAGVFGYYAALPVNAANVLSFAVTPVLRSSGRASK